MVIKSFGFLKCPIPIRASLGALQHSSSDFCPGLVSDFMRRLFNVLTIVLALNTSCCVEDAFARNGLNQQGNAQDESESPGASSEAPVKLPVPTADDLETGKEEVQEKLGEELAHALSPAMKRNLAIDILRLADDAVSPAVRYLMYEQARELAVEAGDAELVLSTADEEARHFEINLLDIKLDSIGQLMGSAQQPGQIYPLIYATKQSIEHAILEEQFKAASALLRKAITLGRRARDRIVQEDLSEVARELRVTESKHQQLQAMRDALQVNPLDPEANFEIGRFKATRTGNWGEALPLLAQGSDPLWKAAAEVELQGTNDAQGIKRVGDTWWALAEGLEGQELEAVRRRAIAWYNSAMPSLDSEERLRLRTKIAEVFDSRVWRTSEGNPVVLGHSEADTLPQCTIELWFATESTIPGSLIIKRDERNEGSLGIMFNPNAISAWAVGPNIQVPLQPPNNRVSDGRWHHVALVRDGPQIRLFFDGQSVDSAEGVPDLTSTAPWILGVHYRFPRHQTVVDCEYSLIRYSRVVRYRYPFEPRTDYEKDRHTVFLE